MTLASQIFNNIIQNTSFKVLAILIIMDIVFGVLRAIKEGVANSTIGIDGMIRKTAMLMSVVFMCALDTVMDFNLIGFIPEKIKIALNFERVGFNDLFNILYIIFEFLSVLKNMIKCKLPIPKKFQKWLEDVLSKYTNEL